MAKSKTTTKQKKKPAPNKPPRAKKKRPVAAKAKKKPARKQPAYRMLDLHFDNVAANLPLGIERSMTTCLNMFRYELPADYRRMQVEAKRALDGNVAKVVALAHGRGLAMLDAPQVEAMLREIAEDDVAHYASAEE